MHSSNFLSTCIPNAVVNYLLFQSLCWEVQKYYNTHHGRIDVCKIWGLRSAGGRHTRLCTVEIDKIGTKYSMHKIAHAKYWEMCTSSLEGYIGHWNMNNRQSGCKVRYLCQSRPEWQWPVMFSTELQCVCYAHLKFTLEQMTDRIKGLVPSAQWCNQLNWTLCSCISEIKDNANYPAQCECTLKDMYNIERS